MDRIIKAFDDAAPVYERWYTTPLGSYVLESELKALGQILPKKGLGAEVGAGTGIFAKHFSSNDRTITCIEPSVEMTAQLAHKKMLTVIGLAENPPLRAACLDFIYLVTVVEFLADPALAFRLLRTALRKKSVLIILAINRESPWGEAYEKASLRTDSVFRYSTLYTPPELSQMLEDNGYRVTQCLMALEAAPDSTSLPQPSTYTYEILPTAGIFILKSVPSKDRRPID